MDSIAIIVGTSWILAGLVCAGLSIPLLLGNIRRNRLYGCGSDSLSHRTMRGLPSIVSPVNSFLSGQFRW